MHLKYSKCLAQATDIACLLPPPSFTNDSTSRHQLPIPLPTPQSYLLIVIRNSSPPYPLRGRYLVNAEQTRERRHNQEEYHQPMRAARTLLLPRPDHIAQSRFSYVPKPSSILFSIQWNSSLFHGLKGEVIIG